MVRNASDPLVARSHWITAVAAVLVMLAVLGCQFTPAAVNLGLPFGYFGRLNRIVAYVDQLPEVEVLYTLENRDLTIEEITVHTRIHGNREEVLYLPQYPFEQIKPDIDAWHAKVLGASPRD